MLLALFIPKLIAIVVGTIIIIVIFNIVTTQE